jgi:hypothetical protein
MNIRCTKLFLFVFIVLSACAGQAQATPTATFPSPTRTNNPPTEMLIEIPTEISSSTDPALFGTIEQGEIQAFSLEPIANAIFTSVMDGFAANGNIIDYQVMRVTVFPTENGTLYAEITYNVRTTDPSWLVDGGTQAGDNWINDKCNRFDLVTTETEFQLKNKRTCN